MTERWDNTPFFFFRYQFIVNILFCVIIHGFPPWQTARDFVTNFFAGP